jgi:MFS family permease
MIEPTNLIPSVLIWRLTRHCRLVIFRRAAAVLAVAGGSLNDIYNPVERGYAFPIYAGAGFMGPMAAPVIGTAISQFWDWRWNYYLCGIVGCALAAFLSALCPETLGEVILFEKGRVLWKRSQRESSAEPAIRKPLRKKTPFGKFLQ